MAKDTLANRLLWFNFERMFRSRLGAEADFVDLESLDRTLTPSEARAEVERRHHVSLARPREREYTPLDEARQDLMRAHKERSIRAQKTDEAKLAKRAYRITQASEADLGG